MEALGVIALVGIVILLVVVLAVIIRSIPDFLRYQRLRKM